MRAALLRPDPLLAAGGAVVAGCLAWEPLGCPPAGPSLWAAAGLALAALLARTRTVAWLGLGCGLFLLGLGRAAQLPVAGGEEALAEGTVGRVVHTSGMHVLVDTDAGRFQVERWPAPAVGTAVALRGSPQRPRSVLPGEERGAAWTRRWGATAARARWFRKLAAPSAEEAEPSVLQDALHSGILIALARGDRRELEPELKGLLRRTGTSHLLAISGMHIGIVAGLGWLVGRLLAGPLSATRLWPAARLTPASLSWAAAVAYADLVGWPPSALRAVCMVTGVIAAGMLGRRPRAGSLLGGAALLAALASPATTGELGFQLSFLAVAGILLTHRLSPPARWPALLRLPLGLVRVTLGATLGTLPVVAWRFQELSVSSPLANLVVTPLVSLIVVPGALLADQLGAAAALLVPLLDTTLEVCVGMLRVLDAPLLHPAVGPAGALVLLAALPLLRVGVVDGVLLMAATLSLRAIPVGRLQVEVLDVGQGDAALVSWPDGARWLVDGGPPGDAVLRWLRRQGIQRLDAVAVSHAHPDHHGGLLPVLAALPVGELWLPRRPADPDDPLLLLWRAGLAAGAEIRLPGDGGPVRPGLAVLHPTPGFRPKKRRRVNNESLVLEVSHEGRRMLFTGDIEEEAEQWLLQSGRLGRVDVVKAPHHGSRSSSSAAFAAATRPEWLTISCGRDNRFRHPHPEALGAWVGARWLRTDRAGSIRLTFNEDGVQASIIDWWGRAWPTSPTPWRPRPPTPALARGSPAEHRGAPSVSRAHRP